MKKLLMGLLGIPLMLGSSIKVYSALSRTYPLSAITTVRMTAYVDSLNTIGVSTETVELNQWETVQGSWTWISSDQPNINGYYWVQVGTVPTIVLTQWTLSEYTSLIYKDAVMRSINKVMDDDMEQYMVFPSTGDCPVGWKGWRQGLVNGKLIPVACQ